MKNSSELKELRTQKLAEVEAIVEKAKTEKRELTEVEEQRFQTLKSEIEGLKKPIQDAEEREELLKAAAESRKAGGSTAGADAGKSYSAKDEKDLRNFKFTKVIRHLMNPGQNPLDGVEKEVLQEGYNEARNLQVATEGFRIPSQLITPVFNIRAQQATGSTTGSYTGVGAGAGAGAGGGGGGVGYILLN